MNPDLFLAILAMDAYNRGPVGSFPGLAVGGSAIGNAQLGPESFDSGASFYAISYTIGSEKIISYRGTDSGWDIPYWATGAGVYDTTQTRLAAEFYRSIHESNPGADVTLTGHSLGGGLAGFVGSIYGVAGVLFDNMAFELSSDLLYENATTWVTNEFGVGDWLDPIARAAFYPTGSPPQIDRSQLHGYAVAGEPLFYNRGDQSTPIVTISPQTSWGSYTELHKQSLLTILLYAQQLAGTPGENYDPTRTC